MRVTMEERARALCERWRVVDIFGRVYGPAVTAIAAALAEVAKEARRDALEEAAQAADKYDGHDVDGRPLCSPEMHYEICARCRYAHRIADDIRALRDKETP